MSATPDELIDRLSAEDPNDRAKALALLVAAGSAAAGPLTGVLESGAPELRGRAAKALAEIADPTSADALAAAVEDGDPEVRGQAAVGLARIGDARAIDALVRTIDDVPDLLHDPYTLAVYALIDIGEAALPAVEPLLNADDPTTRQRAEIVVRTITGP